VFDEFENLSLTIQFDQMVSSSTLIECNTDLVPALICIARRPRFGCKQRSIHVSREAGAAPSQVVRHTLSVKALAALESTVAN
jgi:hypothetical protein